MCVYFSPQNERASVRLFHFLAFNGVCACGLCLSKCACMVSFFPLRVFKVFLCFNWYHNWWSGFVRRTGFNSKATESL